MKPPTYVVIDATTGSAMALWHPFAELPDLPRTGILLGDPPGYQPGCDYHGIDLRTACATAFPSRRKAIAAIRRTLRFARTQENWGHLSTEYVIYELSEAR